MNKDNYEFAKASSRHKIYYNDVSELMEHIAKLKNLWLVDSK